jgi:dTDP-4-dehydrorhamnose reductase
VFSLDKGDETIFDEMARILSGGGTVKAASDQTFCPTLISDVYHAVTRIQEKKLNGTFNVCSPEIWTRYSMAVELAKAMKINPRSIQQISLDDLGLGYVRPKDTSMVAERLNQETQFGFVPIFHCIDKISKNWIMA